MSFYFFVGYVVCELEYLIGKCGFIVVYVGDDGEVLDFGGGGHCVG